jgi:hypothetical protein
MRKTLTILLIGASALLAGVMSAASSYDVIPVSKTGKTLIADFSDVILVNDGQVAFESIVLVAPSFIVTEAIVIQVIRPEAPAAYADGALKNKYHSWYLFHPRKVPIRS